MKIPKFLILLILFLSGIGKYTVKAQNTIHDKAEHIETESKPLQFGKDFMPLSSIHTDRDFPEIYLITEYEKYYRFKYLTYDPVRDPRRLGMNFTVYVGAALISYGVLWILPESVTGWDKESMRNGEMFKRWKENVSAGPMWDNDDFYLNWIMHPWIGGIYYMSARGSGFKAWESFTFSFLMSTFFWEFGIEAFAEVPSWQDIIITPTLGSLLGEGFFIAKKKIIRNEKKVLNSKVLGGISLFIIDPINMVVDGFGYNSKKKMKITSAVMPVGLDLTSGKAVWGLQVAVKF
jgi:hypothetical protein